MTTRRQNVVKQKYDAWFRLQDRAVKAVVFGPLLGRHLLLLRLGAFCEYDQLSNVGQWGLYQA